MAGVGELTLQLRITSIPGVPEGWVPDQIRHSAERRMVLLPHDGQADPASFGCGCDPARPPADRHASGGP
jgi:hypothetical protein